MGLLRLIDVFWFGFHNYEHFIILKLFGIMSDGCDGYAVYRVKIKSKFTPILLFSGTLSNVEIVHVISCWCLSVLCSICYLV